MSEFESRLTTLLHERAAVARPFDQLDAVTDGVTYVRDSTPRHGSWRPSLAVAAGLMLVVAGLLVFNGRDSGQHASEPLDAGPRFSFVTKQVSLTADDFWIDVGGQRFTTIGADVEVHSDPGDASYQTLELQWNEHGVEMRLYMYFQADGNEWASNEFWTYNGNAEGDWVRFTGDFFRTPLGSPATGVFDDTATENGITSHLHIEGMNLQAFLEPAACGAPATPIALVSSVATIDGEVGLAYGASIAAIDTATCLPVSGDGLNFEISSANPEIALVLAPEHQLDRIAEGVVRVDLDLVGTGSTTIHVVARDAATGQVVDETEIAVTVN